MKTYEFNYKDNEGDEFSSEEFTSLSDAKAEIKRLRKLYDGDFAVTESWIYRNGIYVGSFS